MVPTTVNTRDHFQHGDVCTTAELSLPITYNLSFTAIMNDEGDVFVTSSLLSIAVPLDIQRQNMTTLCISCRSQGYAH